MAEQTRGHPSSTLPSRVREPREPLDRRQLTIVTGSRDLSRAFRRLNGLGRHTGRAFARNAESGALARGGTFHPVRIRRAGKTRLDAHPSGRRAAKVHSESRSPVFRFHSTGTV